MIPPSSTAAHTNTAQTAALDGEHDDATMASDAELGLKSSNNSNSKPSRRPPPLSFGASTTIPSCTCGESLCGYDCHFLQQEIKELEAVAAAAAAARGAHQRSRPRRDSTGSTSSEDQQQLQNDDGGIADLERRFRRHFSTAASAVSDDTCVDDILFNADVSPPARMSMRRTKSCGVHSAEFDQEQLRMRHNPYRLRIGYHDEALRERCEQNTHALLQRAVSDSSSSDVTSTTTILARKALRYRRVLERMEGVDVTDLSLDLSECLGVRWQRVGSPK